MLREAGRGRPLRVHARARPRDALRRALAAAPRAAARPRRRGDRAPAQRRPRSAPAAARLPLRAGGAGRAARARDRLRARRRPPRRPPAGLGGGGPALPRRAARARAGRASARTRCAAELLLALGASEDRAGMEEEARATFQRRRGDRARLGDPSLLGRAALGFAGQWSILGRVDEARARRCSRRRSTALGDEDSPLRARLLARLALELYYSGDPERRLALSEEAVELARRLGDPRTLATCLDARHYALWRPENVNERLEVAAELRRVAEQTGDPELELEGAGWTVVDLLELGDVQGADIQIAAASKLAEALQRPIWLLVDVAAALHARAARRPVRRGRAARRGDARDRPPRPGRERASTRTRRRCSTSAASRAAWPRSSRPCGGFIELYPDARGLARRARAAAGRARARSTRRAPSSRRWRRPTTCRATPTG